jgi:hypothetical protein
MKVVTQRIVNRPGRCDCPVIYFKSFKLEEEVIEALQLIFLFV